MQLVKRSANGLVVANLPPSYNRIIEAARQEILTSGVIGLRVSAVAAAAGTSMPLIYKYFGDRDGLVNEVLGQIYFDFNEEALLQVRRFFYQENLLISSLTFKQLEQLRDYLNVKRT